MSTQFTFPDVEINICKPSTPVEVSIVENRICTKESSPNIIRHITFDITGTPLEGKIVAGQSIGILAPGVDEQGKPHKVRLYSVSSPTAGEDGQGKWVSTTVKRVIAEHWETQELFTGVCSNYLSSLKPGSKVLMTGPSGKRFILPEHPERYNYVFFATGTGIAPFRGMMMDLVAKGAKSQAALVFGCPYRTDLLYHDYFEHISKTFETMHYLTCISREQTRKNGGKLYVQHMIEERADVLKPILEQDNTLMYICGLKGMESGIFLELAKLGLMDYLKVTDELKNKPVAEWSAEELKKSVKNSDRMLVEVY